MKNILFSFFHFFLLLICSIGGVMLIFSQILDTPFFMGPMFHISSYTGTSLADIHNNPTYLVCDDGTCSRVPIQSSLSYKFKFCELDHPCSPLEDYYISSVCYGYISHTSNQGSFGIVTIVDEIPFSDNKNSRYACQVGDKDYDDFFLYFF